MKDEDEFNVEIIPNPSIKDLVSVEVTYSGHSDITTCSPDDVEVVVEKLKHYLLRDFPSPKTSQEKIQIGGEESKMSFGKVTKSAKKGVVKKSVAKKEASSGRRGRKSAFPLDAKITVVAKENPKREGTDGYKRFELYQKNKTVDSFLQSGGRKADLRWDVDKGFIKIGGGA